MAEHPAFPSWERPRIIHGAYYVRSGLREGFGASFPASRIGLGGSVTTFP
jgi:hypothetical protein